MTKPVNGISEGLEKTERPAKSIEEILGGSKEEGMAFRYRSHPAWLNNLALVLAVLFSGFHIVTGLIGNLPGIQQRVIHATLGWMLIFLLVPAHPKFKEKRWALFLDFILAGISLIIGIYVYFSFFSYHERVGLSVPTTDLILGTIAIIFTCELCRRAIGKPFFIMTLGFIAFAFLGPYLPDLVSHKGMNITEMVGAFFLTTSGIYGMITGVSATYIAIFIILAAFIRESGVGDFFMKISLSIFGTVRGARGPGQDGGGGQLFVWDDYGEFHSKRGKCWFFHDSAHEKKWIPILLRRGRRGCGKLRGSADASYHGGVCIHHDRNLRH